MAKARNYFAWQGRVVRPHLGRRVVEVGCGTGNFTGNLLDRELVVAIDVEADCLKRLNRRYLDRPNLHVQLCSPGDAGFDALRRFQPDSCVCLNVLEHIADDRAALEAMAAILPPGAPIVLLAPAFPALYGPIDRGLGHHRRYTLHSLKRVARMAGLETVQIRYMNLPGFFGWWANARLFHRKEQSGMQIALFDRLLAPFVSRMESVVAPPFGLSVFAILRKPT